VGSLVEQVVGGPVGVLALIGIELEAGGFAADRSARVPQLVGTRMGVEGP
jgi:hypothetical protein